MGARGRWNERKYLLFELLGQYGVECLSCDDAHDLSMPHLIFLKELTDHLFLSFPSHPLGLCLVKQAWGIYSPQRGVRPARNHVDAISTTPGLPAGLLSEKLASHTEGEVRDILLALERFLARLFPICICSSGPASSAPWLAHPLLDPQKSGRVLMDHLMKLVTIALQRSYATGEGDVSPKHLEDAAEQLTHRRDKISVIDVQIRRRKTSVRNKNP